jgi:aminocarboxymuconate-semialdehyde decarboxylase
MPRKGACVSTRVTIGVDKSVFASDAPFDLEGGNMLMRQSIKVIDPLDISEKDRKKVYHDTAVELMRLTGI